MADTPACLRRVADGWRIEVTDERLAQVAHDFSFDRLREAVRGANGYIGDMVSRGHLRSGQASAWRDEFPPEIAADIQGRFAGYQTRLGYRGTEWVTTARTSAFRRRIASDECR